MSTSRYLDFKLLDFFKDEFLGIVNEDLPKKESSDIYKHILLCPPEIANRHQFQLHGYSLPRLSYWPQSLPSLSSNDSGYGRSVLKRYEFHDKDGNSHSPVRFLDLTFDFSLSYASSSRSTIGAFNDHLIMLDVQRFFEMDFSECAPGFKSKCIFQQKSPPVFRIEALDKFRYFTLTSTYSFTGTVPVLQDYSRPKRVEIYLNNHKIWETSASPLLSP